MQRILSKIHPYRDLLCVKPTNANPTERSIHDTGTRRDRRRRDDSSSVLLRSNIADNQKYDQDFQTPIDPSQMRCLALVSHN